MKIHTIKTHTAELMIVELPEHGCYNLNKNRIAFYDNSKKERLHIKGSYTLLGKVDEIKEEDAKQTMSTENYVFNDQICSAYIFYGNERKCYTESAKKSLLSLLESEIYWENPIPTPEIQGGYDEFGNFHGGYDDNWISAFVEAERNTFDRNRSVIFKKVTPKI